MSGVIKVETVNCKLKSIEPHFSVALIMAPEGNVENSHRFTFSAVFTIRAYIICQMGHLLIQSRSVHAIGQY